MSTQPSKLSIIFAGEDRCATFIAGGPAATSVRVRAMPARHLARVLQLADLEAELLDLVCFLPREGGGFDPVESGWSDNLTDASHAELYEAAKRLNFSRAATWAERQIAAKKFTGELALKAEEAITPLLKQMIGLLGSLSKPSASPAAPSTRS